jgi:hypothetical protein
MRDGDWFGTKRRMPLTTHNIDRTARGDHMRLKNNPGTLAPLAERTPRVDFSHAYQPLIIHARVVLVGAR